MGLRRLVRIIRSGPIRTRLCCWCLLNRGLRCIRRGRLTVSGVRLWRIALLLRIGGLVRCSIIISAKFSDHIQGILPETAGAAVDPY